MTKCVNHHDIRGNNFKRELNKCGIMVVTGSHNFKYDVEK